MLCRLFAGAHQPFHRKEKGDHNNCGHPGNNKIVPLASHTSHAMLQSAAAIQAIVSAAFFIRILFAFLLEFYQVEYGFYLFRRNRFSFVAPTCPFIID